MLRAAMPVAPVHKHGHTLAAKDNVDLCREVASLNAGVLAETEPLSVETSA
jgi:hypothetical protein